MGSGITSFITQTGKLVNQPQQYGLVFQWSAGGESPEVAQLWSSQPGGSLYHRAGNASNWGKQWTKLLDVNNFSSHALPITGGTLNCSNTSGVTWLLNLHQTSNANSSGWGAGIKFKNASDSENKWCGIAGKATTNYANGNGLFFYTNATEQFYMKDDRFYAPKLVTTSYGTSDPKTAGISGTNGQLYFQVI